MKARAVVCCCLTYAFSCGSDPASASMPQTTAGAGQPGLVPAAGASAAAAQGSVVGSGSAGSFGTRGTPGSRTSGDAAAAAAASRSPMTGNSAGSRGEAGASASGAVDAMAGRGAAVAGAGGGAVDAGAMSGAGAAGRSAQDQDMATAGRPATTSCDFAEPPADVASWVDQSWDAQLGNNIRSREAWNLDHVMLNDGSINLCVRWGATSAVPAEVHMNLASTVERWFNDWFKGLSDYGCFPYGDGIKVKITGWAVRPGRESLLEGVDPAIPVYTETDGEGEPKCPDACSSFVHWDHEFPDCAAGPDMHSDYWLWFDDTLPGGGGAAAVGGDWGLRMPVSTFLNAFGKPSDHIVEHEMGHGFGFQDYYDWNGARPEGGSIMIVGSSQSESPTMADAWLLRRTWAEMKGMRGW